MSTIAIRLLTSCRTTPDRHRVAGPRARWLRDKMATRSVLRAVNACSSRESPHQKRKSDGRNVVPRLCPVYARPRLAGRCLMAGLSRSLESGAAIIVPSQDDAGRSRWRFRPSRKRCCASVAEPAALAQLVRPIRVLSAGISVGESPFCGRRTGCKDPYAAQIRSIRPARAFCDWHADARTAPAFRRCSRRTLAQARAWKQTAQHHQRSSLLPHLHFVDRSQHGGNPKPLLRAPARQGEGAAGF